MDARLRWVFPIRLQLSGVIYINNGVIFKNSHSYQILLPFLFLRIFVPKFENVQILIENYLVYSLSWQ